jgi:hypothetical protein
MLRLFDAALPFALLHPRKLSLFAFLRRGEQ